MISFYSGCSSLSCEHLFQLLVAELSEWPFLKHAHTHSHTPCSAAAVPLPALTEGPQSRRLICICSGLWENVDCCCCSLLLRRWKCLFWGILKLGALFVDVEPRREVFLDGLTVAGPQKRNICRHCFCCEGKVVSLTAGLCWNNCYLEIDSIFGQIWMISCSDIGVMAPLWARDSLSISYFELHFGFHSHLGILTSNFFMSYQRPICEMRAHIYAPNKQLKKGDMLTSVQWLA